MDKLRHALSRFPRWIFTILTVLLILWLTLMPDPLGDTTPTLFPGADKVVHAIMFGFLTTMILLDHQRNISWRPVSSGYITGAAIVSSLMGILVEVLQLKMDMGRGFEPADMVADILGAVICAVCWKIFQNRWSVSND